MNAESDNFEEAIHDEHYSKKYDNNHKTHEDTVFTHGRKSESLNGQWNFTIDPCDTFLRAQWYLEKKMSDAGLEYPLDYDFDQWKKISLPSCWNLFEKEYFWYEGPAVYTRTFKYRNKGEKKVFLKIGAANYQAKVFLNKEYLGCHKGGSTPFYFEISEYLQEDNRIIIQVDNTRKATNVPARNTDWFNYGGVYRDVELFRLPEVFIKGFNINLVPDGQFNKIKIDIMLSDARTDGSAGLKISRLGISRTINIKNGKGTLIVEAKPVLWNPGHPELYDVEVHFRNDCVKDEIGFREIRVDGVDILLNGNKIFLKGISIHEDSVENGKAISEEEIRENFNILKDLGCNYARLAHYPHTEKAARIADEMGIMLWEEIPVYWAIDFKNRETYSDAENQLLELIKRDQNRASVIIWSVGNENPDSDIRLEFMKSLILKTREVDNSRLVSTACLFDKVKLVIKDRLMEYLDIIGINEYYGWYEPDIDDLKKLFENSRISKPVIISEFGADARAGARGSADELWTEDKQLAIYESQTKVFKEIPYVKGISPWILYDFRCPRRTNPFQEFYNRKGLLSEDKKMKKLAYYCLQNYFREN